MIEKYIHWLKSIGDAMQMEDGIALAFAEAIAAISLALASILLCSCRR